jgi:hypothetical protein
MVETNYGYDKANNRSNVQVTGSPNPRPEPECEGSWGIGEDQRDAERRQ